MKFLRELVTGIDNQTHDLGRYCLLAGVAVFLFCSVWMVVVKGTFDPQAFGIGFGAIVAGGCGGLALKSKTEPGG